MKRLCGILLALAGLFLYAPCAAQNTRVRGTVTDAQTGEPIPYAVVLFPGTTTGITTDDEGFYSLESRDTSSYIRAEMVSYEPQIRPVHVGGYNQIDFRLTPSHLEIESVVITPGDNPAHPILEGIIRNKKYNDSKEYDRYICRTYTKMELGLANIREFRSKKLQQNFGFIFEHLDTSSVTGQPYLPVMISETAADYYHSRTPSVAREVIRASQISGIEDNSVLAQFTGHLHADVNLYENFIDLFGVKFASPLSNSGRSFYKYFLVDSTNVEGRKTYKIRFHPKSVATPVLDGEVNIDSASYALRSARVKMAKGVNVNWIRHLAIEADNRLTADSLWFPQREKMTADFTLTKSDSSKMIAFLGSHEVTYSDVKFDTPIPKQVLGTSASVILSDDAITDKVCDQITVGIQPTSLVMDKYNKIWTVTDGGYEGSPYGHEAPSLYCIDAATRKIEKQFKFKFGDWPSEVQLNGTRDTIYFINKAVWRLPVTADKFPVKPFLPYNNTLYYGLTINPVNSEVYIADAIDYVQNGVVLRYSPDGELLDEFYVGIIPGAFCWR